MKLPNKQWKRNGVGELRARFLHHMISDEHWTSEGNVEISHANIQPSLILFPSLERHQEPITSDFGGFDFATRAPDGTKIAIEWETGNISSSHRSLNKLAIALRGGILDVGVLIVPSRSLYEHLTDRIGNIGELSGYLSMWEGLKESIPHGLLAITIVEHDELTEDESVPHLQVGQDGRSQEGKAKLV